MRGLLTAAAAADRAAVLARPDTTPTGTNPLPVTVSRRMSATPRDARAPELVSGRAALLAPRAGPDGLASSSPAGSLAAAAGFEASPSSPPGGGGAC